MRNDWTSPWQERPQRPSSMLRGVAPRPWKQTRLKNSGVLRCAVTGPGWRSVISLLDFQRSQNEDVEWSGSVTVRLLSTCLVGVGNLAEKGEVGI